MAVTVNIGAFKHVPFIDDIVFEGHDWSAASFWMQVRPSLGDTGTPLINLTTQTAGMQGISCTYDPTYSYTTEMGTLETAPASKVLIHITEATLEALALANPAYSNLTLKYDLQVQPSGGVKSVEASGDFIIYPGSTLS